MQGKNPVRTILKGDGELLEIKEIYRTIQGEGPNTGEPAIFLRLGGCNLACDFCDTDFENYASMDLQEIIDQVWRQSLEKIVTLVVITGGEPFRQPIGRLCKQLLDKGFKVQIETNGTIYRPVDERVEIICSPKNTGIGYQPIRPDILKRINAFKFLISANNGLYSNVSEIGQTEYNIPVYVQPIDDLNPEKNQANLRKAMEIAAANAYKLSLQWHKIAGIR